MKIKYPMFEEMFLFLILLISFLILYNIPTEDTSHPEEHTIKFKTIFSQPDDITCGPTSAAMVLSHYNKRVSVKEVEKYCKTTWFKYEGKDIGMTSPEFISMSLNAYNISNTLKYGDIDLLKHCISENRPCIVLVRSGDRYWHYIVVYGFTKDQFLIADPHLGSWYSMNIDTLKGCWSWETDMRGKNCDNIYLSSLLKAMQVYPNTFICPDKEFDDQH